MVRPVDVMTINRKPALYETWWAYGIFILIAIGIITYAVLRYRAHLYNENQEMWSDSTEMIKMRQYLESPVSLPDEEFRHLDSLLVSKATEVGRGPPLRTRVRRQRPRFGLQHVALVVHSQD